MQRAKVIHAPIPDLLLTDVMTKLPHLPHSTVDGLEELILLILNAVRGDFEGITVTSVITEDAVVDASVVFFSEYIQ